MIPYLIIALILALLAHWIADFALQSDNIAMRKSSDNEALLEHVSLYSIIMHLVVILLTKNFIPKAFWILVAFFTTHFIIDYISSRIAKYYFQKEERHNFFVTIGFDQFLHTSIIIVVVLFSMLQVHHNTPETYEVNYECLLPGRSVFRESTSEYRGGSRRPEAWQGMVREMWQAAKRSRR